MLFNSYEYILLYLPITVLVYYFLNRKRLVTAATAWLTLASLFFYSWWNVKYIALILGSILFNFGVGAALRTTGPEEGRRIGRRPVLIAGIVGNVLLLGYYKYTDFFIANLNALAGAQFALQKIVLPLGISFFTFTQIAYLVDVYSGRAKEYDLLRYSLFVTFFPHLLAGPIIHHKEMMPQFAQLRRRAINYRNLSLGIYLFFLGLFKKVIIADALSPIANAGFDALPSLTFVEAWVASVSYTLQLYFDFSAYTDMAIGAAWMFNIELPNNFDSPYKALDIADFWRRWHMTLSRFLRDYIYIPLGGNRAGDSRTYRNLMATFLVGGIWHGAGWTFVFWGFLHGMASVIHRFWSRLGLTLHKAVAWFLTFMFVNVAWVFFRARTWDDALKVLKGMIGANGISLGAWAERYGILKQWGIAAQGLYFVQVKRNAALLVVGAFLLAVLGRNTIRMGEEFKPTVGTALFTIAIALAALLNMNKVSEFLYFNF